MRSFFSFAFFAIVLLCTSQLAFAIVDESGPERILLFDVTAAFEPTGTMQVTERITVLAAGQEIRRGILRQLPLEWHRADEKIFPLQYKIVSVTRDGEPEPYSVREQGGDLDIRIGDATILLPHGPHTYEITYRIRNHFSRFPDWDELYWNVTGNDWTLGIDKARFHLAFRPKEGLPALSVPFRTIDAYTGRNGEKGTDTRINAGNSIETTTFLYPGEGLTVAYTWPRSILSEAEDPENYHPLYRLLIPNGKTILLWIIPALMTCLFLYQAWYLRPKGRRPEIIPLFSPPHDLTPGMLRYIVKGRYDKDSFAADLLNLVGKGTAIFQKKMGEKTRMSLSKVPEKEIGKNRSPLSKAEKWVLGTLFPKNRKTVSLGGEGKPNVRAVRTYLSNRCEEERPLLFTSFKTRWFFTFCLTLGVPLLGMIFFPSEDIFISSMTFLFFSVFAGGLIFMLVQVLRGINGRASALSAVPFLLFMIPFFIAPSTLVINLYPILTEALHLPSGYVGAVLACPVISLIFLFLLPKRTAAGLERLAQAKGLLLYLRTAEQDRFETLYPPERNVQHFEELLPYALALGVGKTWAGTFAAFLAQTNTAAEQFQNFSWSDMNSFRHSSYESSLSPRSSSGGSSSDSSSSFSGSGSSGGGSSGGGSGGGGGSGW